ncbi:MAG: S-layer homology domain-containing protein, partial [Clostridia bacterium]|nr:S-layer homology domain-containing protein [Clostridia bacterium]
VTREQLATFLYTYSEKKGYDVSDRADIGAYTDHANVSDYALEAMKWVVSKGIISGTDKRELLPKDSITRAQMAVVIKSFVENIIPVKVD